MGKPGEHVTKALFQKTEAGNGESGSHLQAKECLLAKELQMLVVGWVLIPEFCYQSSPPLCLGSRPDPRLIYPVLLLLGSLPSLTLLCQQLTKALA